MQTLFGSVELNIEEDAEQSKDEAGEAESQPASEQPAAPAPRAVSRAAGAAPRATRARTPRTPAPAAPAAKGDAGAAAAAAPARRQTRRREPPAPAQRQLPRLLTRYREEIRGQLLREFGYSSVMQAPEVKKVVVNVGLGEALTNARAMETTPLHIAAITGQRPVITKARRSVAGFKVREGNAIGVMVTLRGHRMYEFLDRMISMALPRIRDFRGVPRTSFDGKGNYSLGLREQIMFPEIDYGTVDRVRGLQVTITTSAANDPEGFRLLELMGMPFAREGQTR